MTYDAVERSSELGSPVHLYEFQYGLRYLRYTNQDDTYTYLADDFLATNISHSPVEESAELARNNTKIQVPRDLAIAQLFRIYPPSEEVSIRIYRIHRSDVDQQRVLEWDGRVLNATWYSSRAELHCENILTSFKRKGLRRPYQKNCPHDLFSQGAGLCNADKPAFKVPSTILTVNGPFITSAEIDVAEEGYFDGGILEWEVSPDNWELRHIKIHIGDQIELAQPLENLEPGTVVDLYPGCAHDESNKGCHRFNNIKNYGGVPIASKNPFGQSGIG